MATRSAERPVRRRRRPEEAEREILEAAGELLRERPSDEVTVAAVMGRTTLSRKSFYVYFRDRYELITRLVEPLRSALDGTIAAWSEESRREPRDAGRRVLLAIAGTYIQHGELLRALAEASQRDADAKRAWRDFTEPAIAAAAERIREDIATGLIAPLDPEATARALVGMNLHAFFEQLIGRPDADPEQVVETLVEVWMRTLYGPPGR